MVNTAGNSALKCCWCESPGRATSSLITHTCAASTHSRSFCPRAVGCGHSGRGLILAHSVPARHVDSALKLPPPGPGAEDLLSRGLCCWALCPVCPVAALLLGPLCCGRTNCLVPSSQAFPEVKPDVALRVVQGRRAASKPCLAATLGKCFYIKPLSTLEFDMY